MPKFRSIAPTRPALMAILAFGAWTALSVSLTRFTGGFALLWVSTSILVTMLLPFERLQRRIVLVACGLVSIAITSVLGLGASAALPLAIANLGEVALDVAAIDLARRRSDNPMSLQSVGITYLTGVVIAPAITGLLAMTTAHLVFGTPWFHAWTEWSLSHALGFVTVFPCTILLALGKRGAVAVAKPGSSRAPKLLAPLAMAVVCAACFGQTVAPLLFVPPMLLIYAILMTEAIVAANMMAVLLVVGGGLTLAGYGPINLVASDQSQHLRFFQFYILCVALSCVPMVLTIENRRRLFTALTDSEARYRLLSDFSTDIITISDVNGVLRFVSPSIQQIGHDNPAELIGRSAMEWISSDHRGDIASAHVRVTGNPGTTARVEFLGLVSGKNYRWFETHMRAVVRDDGKIEGVCSMIRDIGQRKRREAELADAAMTDPLTGLANRRAFELLLARPHHIGGEHCVAMLDLDSFKAINDLHGHSAGDEVLRHFAQIARGSVREGDVVARLGGEEFAIFLPDTSLLQAELVCQRLRKRMASQATIVGKVSIKATVSIGLGIVTGNLSLAIERADVALYQAKTNGRNRLAIAA